ncbi:LysR family transcriptional regulator [Paraglaciecola chathamensis]|uniref:Probable transcriptional regulator n=1 Tax=Paraglaciecola agarilytica NO2 TaxID=1125747 RepID=A0ABQ0I2B3_9ALTE|nr:LysR family transcriptional regulator [Paraglaciecola agarilytica]GAC03418.1 probable transcriptional regulator [Paraglaciecola agarilytica NO2]
MQWKIDDLPLFLAVVEQKGISHAAEYLGLSKSHISKAISRLELALGIRLLERNSRNVRVTQEGKAFYEQGLNIMEQVKEADALVSGLTTHPRGKLVVAMPIAFTREFVAPRIGQFRQQYPAIELEIIVTSLPVDIIRDNIDIALIVGTPQNSELIIRKLSDSHLVCIASPEYAADNDLPNHEETLQRHVQFCETRYANSRFPIRIKGQKRLVDLKTNTIKVNDPITVREAVMGGNGVAIIPVQYCKKQLENGTLVNVCNDIEYYMNRSVLSLVYPSRRLVPSKTRVFLDFLIEISQDI